MDAIRGVASMAAMGAFIAWPLRNNKEKSQAFAKHFSDALNTYDKLMQQEAKKEAGHA